MTDQRLAKIVCKAFKAIDYNHDPKCIKKLLNFRSIKYDPRATKILKLPKVNTTTHGLKLWCYLAPKLCILLCESDKLLELSRPSKTLKIDLSRLLTYCSFFFIDVIAHRIIVSTLQTVYTYL